MQHVVALNFVYWLFSWLTDVVAVAVVVVGIFRHVSDIIPATTKQRSVALAGKSHTQTYAFNAFERVSVCMFVQV